MVEEKVDNEKVRVVLNPGKLKYLPHPRYVKNVLVCRHIHDHIDVNGVLILGTSQGVRLIIIDCSGISITSISIQEGLETFKL